MRILGGWLLLLILAGTPLRGQQPPALTPYRAAPPTGDWKPAPGPWKIVERALVVTGAAATWQIFISEREIGSIPGERTPVRIVFPRITVCRVLGRDTTAVAILLPTGNRGFGVFPSDAPEQNAVAARMGWDDLGRWPNACRVSILDATGGLDLDRDGFPEIALRRLCSCAASACGGILLVELTAEGPAILDPESLVSGVRVGRLVLEGILPGTDPATPTLQVAPDILEECRLMAILGIRGSNDCTDCCRFPVLLRTGKAGSYEPVYDSQLQAGSLRRAREDIGAVAAGDPEKPLLSIEEAQVARAAAFFYLSGSGLQTRKMISEALGIRARGYRTQDLLRRIEELFMPLSPDGR